MTQPAEPPCPLSPDLPPGLCGCVRASFQQRCQLCQRQIELGTCIVRQPAGWCHALCPEAARRELVLCDGLLDDSQDEAAPGEHAPGPLAIPAPRAPPRRRLSEEQKQVVRFRGEAGQRLRVSAVAGAGKTTTCVSLARRLLREDPSVRILYVVFNRQAKDDATKRFPKEVHVCTSHSLARRRIWPEPFPVSDNSPKLDFMVEKLGLRGPTDQRWGMLEGIDGLTDMATKRKAQSQLQKKARVEARYILKTLANFLWSESPRVLDEHVFWKATIPAERPRKGSTSSGGNTSSVSRGQQEAEVPPLPRRFYRDHAQRIFDRMCDTADEDFQQSSDGYLKLFQLSRQGLGIGSAPLCQEAKCAGRGQPMQDRSGRFGRFFTCISCGSKGNEGYDVIAVDEAQDFTPCQADAFWHHNDACTYLVGDARQRIYRWRGASEDFERLQVANEFQLSETWRFGPEIAHAVNAVLGLTFGDQRVVGKGGPGHVVLPSPESSSVRLDGPLVIVTRSNRGMFEELKERVAGVCSTGPVPTWSFIGGGMQDLVNPSSFEPYLKLLRGEKIRLRGEEFDTWEELREYIEDEGDSKLAAMFEIVEHYQEELPALLEQIRSARVEDWREAELAFITAHKAKGGEFKDVHIARDYRLPLMTDEQGIVMGLLPPSRISRPYWQEELNILYVAMSRAQHSLRLSPEVAEFLDLLGHQPYVPPPRSPPEEVELLDALRLGDEARWRIFEHEARGREDFVVDVTTVPWPRGPEGNMLGLHGGMAEDEVKRLLQVMLMRFHPDKFIARWTTRIPQAERGRNSKLQQKLAETTRAVLALKGDWAPSESAGEARMCVVCYDPPRPADELRTSCCRQVLCRDCFAKLEDPKCPYCRGRNYRAEPTARAKRCPGAGRPRNDRSRSPRRLLGLAGS